MYATPFSVFSQSLDISFYFSCSLSLSYLVFEDSIAASLRLEILSSVVSSLLISSSKIFSIRITAFLIFSISFSFLEFPSQFMLSVLAGCLPIRAFGISVTIVLNSQSDNSNIPIMSDSDTCSGSSNFFFFCLWYTFKFFLRAEQWQYWVKQTVVNKPLVMWWWSIWGGGAFYTLMIGSVFQWPYVSGLWNTSQVIHRIFSPLLAEKRCLEWAWVNYSHPLVSLGVGTSTCRRYQTLKMLKCHSQSSVIHSSSSADSTSEGLCSTIVFIQKIHLYETPGCSRVKLKLSKSQLYFLLSHGRLE